MAIDFHISRPRGIAFFRMNGSLTVRECTEIFVDYNNHRDFDPGLTFLTDSTGLVRIDADFAQIIQAVHRSMYLLRRFRTETRAIIFAPQDRNFGIARMLQQVVEPVSRFRFEITRDEDEALTLARQPETRFADLEAALGLQPCVD